MLPTDKACWAGVFVLYSDDGVGEGDCDGRKGSEVEGSNDVEQLVLREDINQLVVHEDLFGGPSHAFR